MKTSTLDYKKWLLVALFVVPLLIAANQIFRSNFSDLTRWKGGGFGMYTEMYPENRSVWLISESRDTTLVTKIYPITLEQRGKLDPAMREVYRQMRPEVRNLLHYPSGFNYESKRMRKIKEILSIRHQEIEHQLPTAIRVEVQAVEFSLGKSQLESRLLKRKEL